MINLQPTPESRPQPFSANFTQDAAYSVESASRNGSFVMHGLPDHESTQLLAQDITAMAQLRGLDVYEVDCNTNNAKSVDVYREARSVDTFTTNNNQKMMTSGGLVVVKDMDRLIGANSPQPNSAQAEAYNVIARKLVQQKAGEMGSVVICAVSKAPSLEGSGSSRMSKLLGQFAARRAFSGDIEDSYARELLSRRGYDPDAQDVILQEQSQSGAVKYGALALDLNESAVEDMRGRLAAV